MVAHSAAVVAPLPRKSANASPPLWWHAGRASTLVIPVSNRRWLAGVPPSAMLRTVFRAPGALTGRKTALLVMSAQVPGPTHNVETVPHM